MYIYKNKNPGGIHVGDCVIRQSLENQLNIANLQASQTAQTARLLADNAAQTTAIEQYLNPTPVPAYTVQNPNCCAQNTYCGCNM